MVLRAALAASWRAAQRLAVYSPITLSPAAEAGMLLWRSHGCAHAALRRARALAPFRGANWHIVIDELARCAKEEEDEAHHAAH